jgi:hypothetical protein
MDTNSSKFRGNPAAVKGKALFSDDESDELFPVGQFNPSSDMDNLLMSIDGRASSDGTILSVKNLNKLDDVTNAFYVNHQRFVRMKVSCVKSFTEFVVPKSFLQKFSKSIRGGYFRIAVCGFFLKPLYTQRTTSVKIGIIDYRGAENKVPSTTSSSNKILTTRNVTQAVSKAQNEKNFEWINYVTVPTDKMTFSAVNMNSYFATENWSDCRIAIEIKESIVRQGAAAFALDVMISVDETNNPQLYNLVVVPPHVIPEREVRLIRNVESMIKLIHSQIQESNLAETRDGLFADEGSKGTHKGARVIKVEGPQAKKTLRAPEK